MYYLSLREVLIRNQAGTHDQIVPADTPTFVTAPLHDAANAAGCVPCDAAGNVIRPGAAPAAPAYTAEDVKAAVEAVIAVNNKADFNAATGRPKVAPVAKVLGHKPTAEEVEAAWEQVEAR